jgi:tRNA-specific 2-thiouridylase
MTHAKPRVLVGMSGGVDSSLAAALLLEEGYDVIGITLRLYEYEESLEEVTSSKRDCHPLSFIQDAADVAHHLGISHHVVDHREIFKKVIIEPFQASYAEGKTPLPCIRCNRDVKTAALMRVKEEMGVDFIATGHYVRGMEVNGVPQIHQGSDVGRDQSFFLFDLTLPQISCLLFPLGHFSKEETRALAKARGLSVAQKAASKDLCFVSKRTYHSFVESAPGDIVDLSGRVLGQHKGISFYTVGQKQGLNLGGLTESLYVVRVDANKNQLVVGPYQSLEVQKICLDSVNWLAPDALEGGEQKGETESVLEVSVKVRSSGKFFPATLHLQGSKALVQLHQSEYGIAVGQACVFYRGTRLLGGGWIHSTDSLGTQLSQEVS